MFRYFGPPRSLSRNLSKTFPKTSPNRDLKKLSLRVYIHIAVWSNPPVSGKVNQNKAAISSLASLPFEFESIQKDYILQCVLHATIENQLICFQVFEVSDHLRRIWKSIFKPKVNEQNSMFRTTILEIILVWCWKDSGERSWRSKIVTILCLTRICFFIASIKQQLVFLAF